MVLKIVIYEKSYLWVYSLFSVSGHGLMLMAESVCQVVAGVGDLRSIVAQAGDRLGHQYRNAYGFGFHF